MAGSDGRLKAAASQGQASGGPMEGRCPGLSYSGLLALDTRPVPSFLAEETTKDLGDSPIEAARYTSSEFFQRENEKLWPNVWQFAAREEDLPDPGDTVVFENAGRSYLLVRQQDRSVRCFHNVCLHRGRKLRLQSGYAVEIKCPFHGFSWNNDGSLKEIPCAWDFRHLEDRDMSLPKVRVESWQGFLLITENARLPDFRSWAGPAISHFDRWRLDECYTSAWVARVIPANWKVTAEAFMEAWHSITTHPQILGFTGDANTRYDIYGDHMNRAITPSAVLSPHIADQHDQAFVLKKLSEFVAEKDGAGRKAGSRFTEQNGLPEGADPADPVLARKIIAEANRQLFHKMSGHDFAGVSDSEVTDNFTYNIFPNFSPWGGFIPNIVYRWTPWKDQDHCLMEVRILMRNTVGAPMPRGAAMHRIGDDEPFASAAHLIGSGLASVFDQDMANLPYVQEGLKCSANGRVELGRYQESRIRHFHQTLDAYLAS